MLNQIPTPRPFSDRHLGATGEALQPLLEAVGADTLDALMEETLPQPILRKRELRLPDALSEHQLLEVMTTLAEQNQVYRSYIGMGYHGAETPPVIQRNILENPAWYTQYTPYQAEIAQGRLEALLNFQTMVVDLTGLPISNASLLDEATAAAEAMTLLYNQTRSKKLGDTFLVDSRVHPQTLAVLQTRAEPMGIQVQVEELEPGLLSKDAFGLLVQYPDTEGSVEDYRELVNAAHALDLLVAVATDLLSLTLLTPPGEWGADVVVGSAQRFGVPLGYGGPHPAFFATRDAFKRSVPGRMVGASVDVRGKRALRLALQTREQHIRREKATSNICTAQVLLAIMASTYAVYHGPEGLKAIAGRIHLLTVLLRRGLEQAGYTVAHQHFFDTLRINLPSQAEVDALRQRALARQINLRYYTDAPSVGVSLDETTQEFHVAELIELFRGLKGGNGDWSLESLKTELEDALPATLQRSTPYMEQPVFSQYHTETELLRYLKRLETRDLSLAHSMIPLGSCTMKLNATAEMVALSHPGFNNLHPFAPANQAQGYRRMIDELEQYLADITGFSKVSFQPNSGAQGEYAGLMTIRQYLKSQGQGHRHIALIPSSAHGTNPASAVMAGMKVVVVKCDDQGNIDLDDLQAKVEQHSQNLAALMVTYPSTHGVFETAIRDICALIHQHGGQVYMDGANMNAQVGLTSPGLIGADVCHLNLHKTFCIPHGGGGPGMGPIGVAAHLGPHLPGHPLLDENRPGAMGAIASAPYSSASILTISYAYIRMMGAQGVLESTQVAILNANYINERLKEYYPVLYTGKSGRVAHELILDLRQFKHQAGVEVEDIAKRLMDYGYHAPTVSFPVPGTMMIEPTESESPAELERFCQAMIGIRQEIQEVLDGKADKENNLLKNAPHTADLLTADEWDKPYSRQRAAYPAEWLHDFKFWPSVARVNNVYGDRNLVCTCAPIEAYAEG